MKEIYLHVGYHKTGTTAIQNFMHRNKDLILSEGILYPLTGLSGAGHSKLANAFKGNEWDKVLKSLLPKENEIRQNIYALERGESSASLYMALKSEVAKSEVKKIVLSSECFLEWIDPQEVKEALAGINASIKIIFYFREPKQWIEAVYYQLIKDRYFRYSGEIEDLPQWEMLNYNAVLQDWALVFGRNNLIVRQYENTTCLEHGVITDFLNIIGLSEVNNFQYPTAVSDVNLGLHPLLIKLLKHTNKLNFSEKFHKRVLKFLYPISNWLIKVRS
ncbi:hypothetical protein Ssed_3005 [Shewanella sediminis HAW-EB3]|uniref:Sulfotransferase domain-containing protein n=1 Tax=Shewanella sediminis (strain HAW-EB3) TaxID=425104 RepID=A8FXN6_SHESH|nr:hypothetical protein [Shewanella sediminis]ABV37609.1 hypothetical protein Ssed_3005 [Shewanella sediminis HAW-EB3]